MSGQWCYASLGLYGARNNLYYPGAFLGGGVGQLATVGSNVDAHRGLLSGMEDIWDE